MDTHDPRETIRVLQTLVVPSAKGRWKKLQIYVKATAVARAQRREEREWGHFTGGPGHVDSAAGGGGGGGGGASPPRARGPKRIVYRSPSPSAKKKEGGGVGAKEENGASPRSGAGSVVEDVGGGGEHGKKHGRNDADASLFESHSVMPHHHAHTAADMWDHPSRAYAHANHSHDNNRPHVHGAAMLLKMEGGHTGTDVRGSSRSRSPDRNTGRGRGRSRSRSPGRASPGASPRSATRTPSNPVSPVSPVSPASPATPSTHEDDRGSSAGAGSGATKKEGKKGKGGKRERKKRRGKGATKGKGGSGADETLVKYGAVPPVSAWSCNQCDAMFTSFNEMRFHEVDNHGGILQALPTMVIGDGEGRGERGMEGKRGVKGKRGPEGKRKEGGEEGRENGEENEGPGARQRRRGLLAGRAQDGWDERMLRRNLRLQVVEESVKSVESSVNGWEEEEYQEVVAKLTKVHKRAMQKAFVTERRRPKRGGVRRKAPGRPGRKNREGVGLSEGVDTHGVRVVSPAKSRRLSVASSIANGRVHFRTAQRPKSATQARRASAEAGGGGSGGGGGGGGSVISAGGGGGTWSERTVGGRERTARRDEALTAFAAMRLVKKGRQAEIDAKMANWDQKPRVLVVSKETQGILGLRGEAHAREVMAHLAVSLFEVDRKTGAMRCNFVDRGHRNEAQAWVAATKRARLQHLMDKRAAEVVTMSDGSVAVGVSDKERAAMGVATRQGTERRRPSSATASRSDAGRGRGRGQNREGVGGYGGGEGGGSGGGDAAVGGDNNDDAAVRGGGAMDDAQQHAVPELARNFDEYLQLSGQHRKEWTGGKSLQTQPPRSKAAAAAAVAAASLAATDEKAAKRAAAHAVVHILPWSDCGQVGIYVGDDKILYGANHGRQVIDLGDVDLGGGGESGGAC